MRAAEQVGRIRRLSDELGGSRLQSLQRLALAAEHRGDGTHRHTERVARTSRAVAVHLGLSPWQAELIQRAAPLHDVGKLALPNAILLKPGRLTPAEFAQMMEHTTIGAAILSDPASEVLRGAEEVALTHHEWWDGRGYPANLAGRAIPLMGRIVALADVFDALTHERPYKRAWSVDRAIAEITLRRGSQFDPEIVDAFLELEPERFVELPARAATRQPPPYVTIKSVSSPTMKPAPTISRPSSRWP